MKILPRALLALPALFLAPHAIAREPATTPVSTSEAKAPRKATPALWILKDDDTTIYLFGTIHALPKDIAWFEGGLKDAFLSSGELVTEMIEPDDASMAGLMQEKGMNPAGVTLRSQMNAQQLQRYETGMAELGLPVTMFDTMKPWLAAMMIGVMPLIKEGYDPSSGAERVLEQALGERKHIGLETAEQQLSFLDDLPDPIEFQYLDEVVQESGWIIAEMNKLLDAWIAGDPELVGSLMNEATDGTPEITAALLTNRNANWTQWIDDRLDQPGTVFIAVGAGHLAGNNNVRDMLAQRGIIVSRVNY